MHDLALMWFNFAQSINLCPFPKAEAAPRQMCCRAVAEDAHEKWAMWAAQSLAQQLAQQLNADAALTSPVALRSWQETVIKAV